MIDVVNFPGFAHKFCLPLPFFQKIQSLLNPSFLIDFSPAFFKSLNHWFEVIVVWNQFHCFLVLLMSLEPGERSEHNECIFLIFVGWKLFFEAIVDIQNFMVNCEFVSFQSFLQPLVVAFDDLEFELDFLWCVVVFKLYITQKTFSFFVILQIVIKWFPFGIVA